jgi:hypothetical protein
MVENAAPSALSAGVAGSGAVDVLFTGRRPPLLGGVARTLSGASYTSQAAASGASRPSTRGALAKTTSPGGRSTGWSPALSAHTRPPRPRQHGIDDARLVRLLRSFDPAAPSAARDVKNPYSAGDFKHCFGLIEAALPGLHRWVDTRLDTVAASDSPGVTRADRERMATAK